MFKLPNRITAGLDIVRVRPNFYVIAGAGGNIAVQIGSDGVVLVNAGSDAGADRVIAAIKKLTDLPVRYIIDTSADADFVGGNSKISKAGQTIFTNLLGNAGLTSAMTNGGAAAIMAHDSILQKMSAPTGKAAVYPARTRGPRKLTTEKRKALRVNDEGIESSVSDGGSQRYRQFRVFPRLGCRCDRRHSRQDPLSGDRYC